MSELEDITPEGSVGPVYLDPTPLAPVESLPDLQEQIDAQNALKASATFRLMALGLPEDEARAVTGYTGPLQGGE